MTPRKLGGDYHAVLSNTIDVHSPRSHLNMEALKSLNGDSPNEKEQRMKDYAESLKSGVLSARKRQGLLKDDDD